ncbi:12-oxophytodienoate reductase [Vibrio natriegens]|uniref:NADH:flavin oxidoreductase n=1 Tax=Vibrio natriegens TaxID=691 RepID=UPI000803F489|nr:NADH:flavin oxidoreductase [Vibrio natriegens]ANQ25154.1 12-oxophytodienoate reductase [Vibrio natriegens]
MASSNVDILFRPFQVRSLKLPNRLVMAPMTRSFAPDGIVTEANAEYYSKRAKGGVGLILSEGTVINRPSSRNDPNVPKFYGDEALAGWKGVVDAVHEDGGKMGPQLWHTGSTRSYATDWEPSTPVESPSGLIAPGQLRGVSMTDEDIADTIAAHAAAAADAKRLGFDIVEIHAAHGYLIDQFFWEATNLRFDSYGGSTIRERSKFAAEVIKATRVAVGDDFPISVRLSQWKQDDYTAKLVNGPDQMAEWLEPLADAGADILHCSQRRFWEAEFPHIDGENGLNLAGWAKKLTGLATISVGSVGLSGDFFSAFSGQSSTTVGLDRLIERMERDEFDLIAVGRALLTDPMWVEKVRSGSVDKLSGFDPSSLGTLV